jgi:hypothetical protein
MSWINWGSESQQQLEMRRQFEEQVALYEQAVRIRRAQAQAAGSGGASYDPTSNSFVEDDYVEDYLE